MKFTESFLEIFIIPGLEENAIMIDSVSKDTVCVVQELVALFQKNKELMAAAMKLLKQD
jgi:hypothetical protein